MLTHILADILEVVAHPDMRRWPNVSCLGGTGVGLHGHHKHRNKQIAYVMCEA